MKIQINKIYKSGLHITKYFEKVSDNLILFNIIVENDSFKLDSRPIHWRYDFGDFPPLDISFDSDTGLIKEITIFINKKNIRGEYKIEESNLMNLRGFPSFTSDILEKHKYYYDEVCQMEVSLLNSTLSVYLLDKKIQKKIIVNEELNLLLSEENDFIGLKVSCLSIDNLEFLK